MISPPEELQDFLDIDPDAGGFVLKPGAPPDVVRYFEKWVKEIEEAESLGIRF